MQDLQRLQVDSDHDAQPYRVESHCKQHGTNDRHNNKRNLNEVEDEAEQKHHEHYDDDGCDNAAR